MHTCEGDSNDDNDDDDHDDDHNDDDDDDDDHNDDDDDVIRDIDNDQDDQAVEAKDFLQEQLSSDHHHIASELTKELSKSGVDKSTEDESDNSDSDLDDKMVQFSQLNHLQRPHRDPIPSDQASGIEKTAILVDATTVRRQVKRTLMKKQKAQRRQPPLPQGGSQKVRKHQSKRKQIPDYIF